MCGATLVPSGATRQKLSRFPSTPRKSVFLWKFYLPVCSIPGTAGHSCCMAKLISDNRVVAVLFFILTVVNAFALQHGWYA